MTDKEKRMIDKLLRMSMSSNPNEAAVAAEKLAEILAKNGITQADAEQLVHRNQIAWMKTKYKEIPKWHHLLTGNLAAISGVYAVKASDSYVLSGQPEDLENFVYIIEFVSGELERMARLHQKTMPKPRHHTELARRSAARKRMEAYRQGVIIGVCMRLRGGVESFFSSPTSGKDLVPVDTRFQSAKKLLEGRFGDIEKSTYALSDEKKHIHAGIEDGVGITIRKGVGGRNTPVLDNGGGA